jgi:hypothetical protein
MDAQERPSAIAFILLAVVTGRADHVAMQAQNLLWLIAAAPITDASAESMRCDKWVVNETASVAELLEKCGAPASKDVIVDDVIARNPTTGARNKVGTTVKEHWLYQRGAQSLPMRVTIVDGKIISIERTDK